MKIAAGNVAICVIGATSGLPLAKDIDDFTYKGTPINESLVRDLAGGNFIAQQRNVVLVGGTEPDSCCSPRDVIGI